MRSITTVATSTRPPRSARHRKPSSFSSLMTVQIALGLAVLQLKLMPNFIGKCGMGHDLFQCETCKGPGQCQSDPTCNSGLRCTGGCTNL